MIFTASELGADASQIFARVGTGEHTYPSPYAITGLVAYSSWLLIVARGAMPPWKKRALGGICILALLFIASYPLINPYVDSIDIAGSVLFAASCLAFGIFVATRVGVNLFQHEELAERPHE